MNKRIFNILTEDCGLSEEEISTMSKSEILEAILHYEGFIGYTAWIKNMINDIYGLDLDEIDYGRD